MLIRALKFASAMLLPLLAAAVDAQGLGDELILSRLGDPVEIEIDVRDWQGVDLRQIEIANASQQQYTAFDLTYLPILDTLSFNLVGPNRAGQVKILVSSRDPVSEPFMDLLLVLRWPGGSSLREYVVLFDPPLPDFANEPPAVTTAPASAAEPAVQPAVPAPVVVPDPVAPAAAVDKPAVAEPAPSPPAAAPIASVPKAEVPKVEVPAASPPIKQAPVVEPPAQLPVTANGREQYTVQPGETLWDVAQQFNPAGVSVNLYQFLISAHSLNRGAFVNDDISALKAGVVLAIPTERDITAVNPGTAKEVFERLWGADVPTDQQQAPPFAALDEPKVEPVTAPAAAPDVELPLGTERVATQANNALSLPTAAPVVVATAPAEPPSTAETEVAPAVVPVKPDPIPVIVERSEPAADNPATTPTATLPVVTVEPLVIASPPATVPAPAAELPVPEIDSSNPYLSEIAQSATAIRNMLSSRQQRMLAIEQQILALQQQMQQAQQRAQSINAGILTKGGDMKDILLLGTLAAFLLLAVGVTVKLGLQWNRETQLHTRAVQRSRQAKQS